MPTYEYECLSCGRHVEVYQRFSDRPLEVCEVCGGQLRKVFHPAGILFKGSGFYVTDSRGGKKAAGDGSKEPAKAGSKETKGSGSSDSSGSSARKDSSSSGSSGSKESSSKGTSS